MSIPTLFMDLYLNFNFIWNITRLLELLLQIFIFSLVISAVWNCLSGDLRVGNTWVLPLSHSAIVVNEENSSVSVNSFFPTLRKGSKVIMLSSVRNIALKLLMVFI